jgi:hypothetical protein
MNRELSGYEQDIVDNVRKYGWQTVSVWGEGDKPGFSYSVGFIETLGAPEFIVFGLPPQLSHSLLDSAFGQLKQGHEPCDGSRWANLIADYDCVLRSVDPSNIVADFLNSALWYHRRFKTECPFRAVQVVWPGALDGLFPWDEECDQIVRDYQPPLYLPSGRSH